MAYLELFADDRILWIYWIGRLHHASHSSPGSFVQVDQARNKVEEGTWRSEFERPIYFVNCATDLPVAGVRKRRIIVLQPHPLSPAAVRVLKYPQEAEILGQVVGVAMRLGGWQYLDSQQRRQCAQH